MRLLAALILLVGAFQLTRAGYSVDEEFTVFAVRGIKDHGVPLLPSALLYDRGLAYSYASWIAGAVSGTELIAYRSLSLLCSLGSVFLTFSLVRRLTTERAALLAAVLVSVSMPFWATATTGRFYAPFLMSYLAVVWMLCNRGTLGTLRTLGTIALLSFLCRLTHELAFTLVAIPLLCALLDARARRVTWLAATAAVTVGLVVAQGGMFLLHALEPSSGETMVRRFFLWQVLNLFEAPPTGQYGTVLVALVIAWLLSPGRAVLGATIALCVTALSVSFSLAQASNLGPLTPQVVKAVLSDGAAYPLEMFRHLATTTPVTVSLVMAGLLARLAGSGGVWPIEQRAVHLLWIFWVLWFGALRDSGITSNYLLLPVTVMLVAIAIDVDAIVRHHLASAGGAGRWLAMAVAGLAALAVGSDQWRGSGSLRERLEVARPTINIEGMDEVRAGIQPADRIACTDELACLMLVGRADYWLALDDFVRQRFLVTRADGVTAGVYTGAPAVFRPGDLFTPNPDGTLPDRVLIVDVFKEYPIGNSRSWVPRAIELDGLQVVPVLETPQGRVLQVSPPERYARFQP